jgi:hypothetical protein
MDSNGNFDDCAICRAMKAAEQEGRNLSEAELFRAFREQQQMGNGVVGFGSDMDR